MHTVWTNVHLYVVKLRTLYPDVEIYMGSYILSSQNEAPGVPMGGECRIGRFVAIPDGKTLQTAVLLAPGLMPGRGQPPAQRPPTASPPWRPAGRSRPPQIRAVRYHPVPSEGQELRATAETSMSPNSFPPPALGSVPSPALAAFSCRLSAGLRLFRPDSLKTRGSGSRLADSSVPFRRQTGRIRLPLERQRRLAGPMCVFTS